MVVQVKYANGYTGMLPNVHWHPAYTQHLGIHGDFQYPAGLWVRESDIRKHLDTRDEVHIKLSSNPIFEQKGKHISDLIKFAEAEIEVYADDTNEDPWRHNGTRSVVISQYGSAEWWNNHA